MALSENLGNVYLVAAFEIGNGNGSQPSFYGIISTRMGAA